MAGPYLLRQMCCITPGAQTQSTEWTGFEKSQPHWDRQTSFSSTGLFPLLSPVSHLQIKYFLPSTPSIKVLDLGPLSQPHLFASQISHPTGHHFLSYYTTLTDVEGQQKRKMIFSIKCYHILLYQYIFILNKRYKFSFIQINIAETVFRQNAVCQF